MNQESFLKTICKHFLYVFSGVNTLTQICSGMWHTALLADDRVSTIGHISNPGGNYWDYHPVDQSSNKVTATHGKYHCV